MAQRKQKERPVIVCTEYRGYGLGAFGYETASGAGGSDHYGWEWQ